MVEKEIFVHEREIWWCYLGKNIGAETNGKGKDFERPVVIIRPYNKHMVLVVPLTTKPKHDPFHFEISTKTGSIFAKLTQTRAISTTRLRRKIRTLDGEVFAALKNAWRRCL